MRVWIMMLVLGLASVTHAISYTVQVAAVSDQGSALTLVRQLLRDQYPAYFVRTTTETGFVFRIRVGAFENRAAALEYADAMPSVAGARPIPALAEAIPAGIMPFAPRLLLTADLQGAVAEILTWRDTVAVRMQHVQPVSEATYYLLDELEPLPFRAWNAAPSDDGMILRVRNLPLWPDPAEDESEAVRTEFATQLRRLIAVQLGVESSLVDEVVFESQAGTPALVVVEQFRLGVVDSGELVGLADPTEGLTRYGPTRFVVGADAAPEPPARIATFSAETEAGAVVDAPVSGGEWTAHPDGRFTRLDVAGLTWRAAVGSPVWASDGLLVTRSDRRLLFYRFEPRAAENAN